jgi:hypothetical protein
VNRLVVSPGCFGTLPRRGFLQIGASVLGGLSLANLLRHPSAAAKIAGESPSKDKAIIVLWRWGA